MPQSISQGRAEVSFEEQLWDHGETIIISLGLLIGNQTATEYLEKCLHTVRIGRNDFLNGYFPATEPISRIYEEDESADRSIHRLSRGWY